MPVTDQTPVDSSTGNGVTTVFPYTFKILDEADILVTVDGVTKILTTDYSVSGVGNDAGGNVTFVAAPANGTTVVRTRDMGYERTTDYQDNGDLPASTLDDDIDRTVMLIQQLRAALLRSVKLPVGTTVEQVLTESAAARADKIMGFDSSGNIVVKAAVDIDVTPVSVFMASVLDDTTWQEALNTLGFKKGADITAAATTDLGTATGNSVDVTHSTGTTAITSLGGASLQAGAEIETRFVISGGTLTLTHHATNLYLAGGADITLANGDVIRWRKMHSSNAEWKMVGGWRADGSSWAVPPSQAEAEAGTATTPRPWTAERVKQAIAAQASGKIVQVVEATPYTTAGSTAATIPLDSTIPQNTEGAELTTVTITPTNASNRLRIEANLPFVDGSAGTFICAALFQDSTANALALGVLTLSGANYAHNITFTHEMAAGTTSATTFKLRAGPSSGTAYFNRRAAGETLGGVSAVRLRVTEIKV